MPSDLTRNTFSAFKHFAAVQIQQGRVQLDADSNEQASILLHYLRTLSTDLHGPYWGTGFNISPISTGAQGAIINGDFLIGAGTYYVDGVLTELESTPVPVLAPRDKTERNKVRVSSILVNGVLFQPSQYIEIVNNSHDNSSLVPRPVWKVLEVDKINRILTLDRDSPIGEIDPINSGNSAYASWSVRRLATYLTQPDYPVAIELGNNSSYQIYLDVWERLITYVEDDSIREVALGGPDTSTRVKIVWQVKVLPLDDATDLCLTPQQIKDRVQKHNRGQLKAKAKSSPTSTDPCILSPKAGYRGTENQLYRVEIHRSGRAWNGVKTTKNEKDLATFKWSRENGSVVFPIVGGGASEVVLENVGRDSRLGLSEGDWVEVVTDDSALQGLAANLLQVVSIDPNNFRVSLSGSLAFDVDTILDQHPLLRRWDHKDSSSNDGGLQLADDGAALIIEDSEDQWLSLEDGIQIQFQAPDQPVGTESPANNEYRSGDYWLIPARSATGDVEWPKTTDNKGNLLSIALPPEGVEHHYAPLSIVTIDNEEHLEIKSCSPRTTEPVVLQSATSAVKR